MDSNQSGAVGGIILGVFQGSLTHVGASSRHRGQKYIKVTLGFLNVLRGGGVTDLGIFLTPPHHTDPELEAIVQGLEVSSP